MRVVMLSWEFPPRVIGGISPHVYNLSLKLVENGVDVYVVTCGLPGVMEREKTDGVHVYRVDSYKLPAPDFASWVYLMNLGLEIQAADVLKSSGSSVSLIHAHDWLVARAAVGLKHQFRQPLIATIHSTEYGRRGGLHTDYERMIHQTEYWLTYEAWRVICCSRFMASQIGEVFGVPSDKIDVIPNGVDVSKFQEPLDLEAFRKHFVREDEKLVLYVGRLAYEKGCSVLIDAIPKVLSKVNAKLIVVGEGYMKDSLVERVQRDGLSDKVYFTGFLDEPTVRRLYRVADVCVVPSLYEPFGIVALEAMAAQTTVVATNSGGLKEVFERDKTGIVVSSHDPDSLAWGIVKALTDKAHAEWLRRKAYQKVLSQYDWVKIAERTKNVYERVLEEYLKGPWKPV